MRVTLKNQCDVIKTSGLNTDTGRLSRNVCMHYNRGYVHAN